MPIEQLTEFIHREGRTIQHCLVHIDLLHGVCAEVSGDLEYIVPLACVRLCEWEGGNEGVESICLGIFLLALCR
jgi:hypothetical protein